MRLLIWPLLMGITGFVSAGPAFLPMATCLAFQDDKFGMIDLGNLNTQPEPRDKVLDMDFTLELFTSLDLQSRPLHFPSLRPAFEADFEWNPAERVKGVAGFRTFYDMGYGIEGRSKYTDGVLSDYEHRFDLGEAYLEITLGSGTYLRAGRQIIAWGESEGYQINDLINPLDLRDLANIEVEKLRLPTSALMFSTKLAAFDLSLVTVHENRVDKMSPQGGEFNFYQSLFALGVEVQPDNRPTNTLDNTEGIIRIFKSFSSGDVTLIAAEVNDNSRYLEAARVGADNHLALVPNFARIRSYGAYGNFVKGAYLFKGELALREGVAFQTATGIPDFFTAAPGETPVVWDTRDTLNGLAGVEYSGISNVTFIFEYQRRKVLDYEGRISNPEYDGGTYFYIRHNAFRETFLWELTWLHTMGDNGDTLTWKGDYDVNDHLSVGMGFAFFYAPVDTAQNVFWRDADKMNFKIRYHF